MKNSRRKGVRGELEFAEYLRDKGYEARRGQQYSGGNDSPDVVTSIDGIHFEVKRVEALRIHAALKQAIDDAGERAPVVAHKRNRGEWIAVMRMDDLVELLKEVER